MNRKISLLLCMCCAGNMCQANPVEEFKVLQSQIKDAVNPRQKGRLLLDLGNNALGWFEQMDGPVRVVLDHIFTRIPNEDDKITIILNILRILVSPEDCLGVTKRVEEIENIKGVRNADVGNLLAEIKTHLKLTDNYSPIVILSKRYPAEPIE
jgi:hypothetical protein